MFIVSKIIWMKILPPSLSLGMLRKRGVWIGWVGVVVYQDSLVLQGS